MQKSISRVAIKLLWIIALITAAAASASAQTISINNVDPGPYTPGSTISVGVHVDYSSGCIAQNNVFNLYLSDANGSFASPTLIGSYSGFYTTFVNGVLPANLPAGTGYKLEVVSTQPALSTASPVAISVVSGASLTTVLNGQSVSSKYPEVYGTSNGVDNTSFSFNNGTNPATAVVTATFINELTQTVEATTVIGPNGYNFNAKAANYTIFVKTVYNGVVSTKAYTLINNSVSNNIGTLNNNTVCLANGSGAIPFTIIPSSIVNNYPGNIYSLSFGDGTGVNLTQCEIQQTNGQVSHVYTFSSCGISSNNAFPIVLQSNNPFIGTVGTPVNTYAKVFDAPVNKITAPLNACANSPVVFMNSSYPGQDPNSTNTSCLNQAAQYTWYVDGVAKLFNARVYDNFNYTFTSPGKHVITLKLQNGTSSCNSASLDYTICISSPPKPSFTVPARTCASSPITPDISSTVVDDNCMVAAFTWAVSGPAAVSYANGTSAASRQPQFVFSAPGTYTVNLSVSSTGCDPVKATPQTIIIDNPPVTKLSADASLCGNNQTLSFGTGAGPTQITLSGSGQATAGTFTWTVTGGDYSFANGTTASSQYPQILFKDYTTYTVSVTQQNACGTTSATQQLTFQQAPTVSAGTDQHICNGAQAALQGTITGTVNSYKWTGGSGTFSSPQSLTTSYTPSAAEVAAGQVTVYLQASTSLAAPCNTILSPVTIFIAPVATVTSANTLNICTGQALNYKITGSDPTSTFTWTASVTSGSATGYTASGSGSTIGDVINVSGTGNAVITYVITPTSASSCPGQPFTLKVTAFPLPVLTTGAASATICSNQPAGISLSSTVAGTSYTWTSTTAGNITGATNQTTPLVVTAINDMLGNTGTAQGSVTYTITPYNNGTCAGTPMQVTINVQPQPVLANPGPDEEVCGTATYTLKGNDPGAGTGKWTLKSAQTGVTFADATQPGTTVSGLVPGNTYQFTWTITAAPTCPPSANTVTITVDKASVGGTSAGAATVCAGNNSGNITLSGYTGTIQQWQYSVNGGSTWNTLAGAVSATQAYSNLTQTTQFRAVVQSGKCSVDYSTVTTITVNATTVAANAGPDDSKCAITTYTLQAVDPTPFTGSWTQTGGPAVTIVSPADPHSQVTGLKGGNVYKFTWTVKGLAPCTDLPDEMVLTDQQDVTPGFTQSVTAGCGTVKVSFTNTSTSTTGASFLWDFGDGSTSTEVNPVHSFAPAANGKDVVYNVTLSVVNNCTLHTPAAGTVTVSPAVPVAVIQPNSLTGCAPFTITAANLSPGTNAKYDYYLYNGATLLTHITKTDKSDISFPPISTTVTKTYTLYMVATNNCGTTSETTHFPIVISPPDISPQFVVQNNTTAGCAPLAVTLINNTVGGTSYKYNFYDAGGKLISQLVAGTANFNYTFNTPGDYSVTISAYDDCTPGGLESPKTYFHIYSVPSPAFTATGRTGCGTVTATFNNTTPADATGTPATSLSYHWDFGDGTSSDAYAPPPHTYTKAGQYTVTLRATNTASSCYNTFAQTNYIIVTALPNVDFSIQPDSVITIPSYHFSFTDETTGAAPTSWLWSFGDGSAASRSQNTSHTYADTGRYTVTLTVTSAAGCPATKVRHVRITGTPGQLFVPNAFIPGSATEELRSFKAKGSGIKAYHLQIFNNWGQLVWETSALDSKGEPLESWDGTYKGTPAPQGVYIWQMSATFINGTEWKGMSYGNDTPKRTGPIHLIR